jgi:AraC-like DNA-binding protein
LPALNESSAQIPSGFKSMLLQSYPHLRTRDRAVIEAALKGYNDRIELPAGRAQSEFIANAARFEDIGLFSSRYNSAISHDVAPNGDVIIGFQIREVSQIALDGEVIENTAHETGCVIPGDRGWHVRNPNGYLVLLLRVASATLQRKLSALLGADRAGLDLRQPSSTSVHRTMLRDAVFDFARELDDVDPNFLPSLVANATEDICIGMLTCLSEPYLGAERSPAAPSSVQLGRVEQYIVANYAKPLTVETLAEISGVSGRSVFRHFRSRYDSTPYQYLERIRLDMAYVRLLACRDQNAVGSMALDCGFRSLRYFEQAYRNQFGKDPAPMLMDRSRRSRR